MLCHTVFPQMNASPQMNAPSNERPCETCYVFKERPPSKERSLSSHLRCLASYFGHSFGRLKTIVWMYWFFPCFLFSLSWLLSISKTFHLQIFHWSIGLLFARGLFTSKLLVYIYAGRIDRILNLSATNLFSLTGLLFYCYEVWFFIISYCSAWQILLNNGTVKIQDILLSFCAYNYTHIRLYIQFKPKCFTIIQRWKHRRW